jgi:hypothetical protein
VQWIFAGSDSVIFIADGQYSPTCDIYCLKKSALSGTNPKPAPAAK